MKKNVLKLVTACLTVGMISLMFVGCGEKKETLNQGRVIEVWSDYASSKKVYTELIEEYNNGQGKKEGVYIEYSVKEGGTLTQNVELALQADDAPDIFAGGSIRKLIENGQIAPIDDLPGGEEFIKYYKDNGLIQNRVNSFNGKTYKIPYSTTLRGLIYNKDMFKTAGIVDENGEAKPPKTYDEMVEYAKRLTDKSKNQYGYIMPLKWSAWINSDIVEPSQASLGYMGYNYAEDKYQYEKMAPIMDALVEMNNNGSCYPGAESIDNDNARAYFAAGRVAMKTAYSFDVGVLNYQFPAQCDWGVAPLPVVKQGEEHYQPITYGYSMAINSTSAKEYGDKIMKVMKFFYDDEFFRKVYEKGVSIPIKSELIESANLGEDAAKGWKDFSKLLLISKAVPRSPDADWSHVPNLQEGFVVNVLKGKKTSEVFLKEYSDYLENGRQTYYSLHTEYKPDECKIDNYDYRRK